jgi:Ca-activated chloride channel homolog
VLLLSDGQANAGETNLDEIATQCAKLADSGVTTSTYGLGHSFNEELMLAMSRAGRGNGYYCETAETLMERFQEEFSLLSSLCARNVRLLLTAMPGVRMEMLNPYEAGENNSWRLPDLAYDGEAWAAVRLTSKARSVPGVGETLAAFQASVSYADLEGEARQLPEAWLALPVVSQNQYLAIPKDEKVVRRVNEAEAAKLQELSSHAARQGDWKTVRELLAKARAMAKHSPWLAEVVENLEKLADQEDMALFSKEATFASANMSSRLRAKTEFAASHDENAMPLHLQRKVRQGGSGHFGQPPKKEV